MALKLIRLITVESQQVETQGFVSFKALRDHAKSNKGTVNPEGKGLQRLKLFVVDDDKGTEIIEFQSYSEINDYASSKEGVVEMPVIEKDKEEYDESKKIRSTKRKSKKKRSGKSKFLENELREEVQVAKNENTNDTKKKSFWDQLK